MSVQDGSPTAFSEATLKAYLAQTPLLAQHFGGKIADLSVTEIGDGNLNFVFFVRGPDAALAIKQALPWSRMSKGARALGSNRLGFETRALQIFAEFAPQHVPHIYHYDEGNALMAQEFLTPHIILRKGLMAAQDYPLLGDHISTYLANCLYGSSGLGMAPSRRRALQADFARNIELCEITERLVFTHPFQTAASNRWSTPDLDAEVAALQANAALITRVQALKLGFLTQSEALLHGDLHSGSIMLTADQTQVIDPEFATFGPMGFDIGMLLGNLMLAYFAQPGHAGRPAYKAQTLRLVEQIWQEFARKFSDLAKADGWSTPLVQPLLSGVLADTIGYAAIEMIRRIIGAAHIAEFETIADAKLRVKCEKAALNHAVALLTHPAPDTIGILTAGL